MIDFEKLEMCSLNLGKVDYSLYLKCLQENHEVAGYV